MLLDEGRDCVTGFTYTITTLGKVKGAFEWGGFGKIREDYLCFNTFGACRLRLHVSQVGC